MLVRSDNWTGLIEDLSICCTNLPYIVSCRVLPAGDWAVWKTMHFSIDEEIDLPPTEETIIKDWILPRLN